MSFSVQPATIADSSARAEIFIAAFKDDPIIGLLTRDIPPETLFAWSRSRNELAFQDGSLNRVKHFKVVNDGTGEVVASARWQFPDTLAADQLAQKEAVEKEEPPKPEGYNMALHEEFFGAIAKAEDKWVDNSKDYVLLGLAVHPDYQGLGLGSLLLREGLVAPDRAGARVYLESSPAGLPLYLRHGWKQVDEVSIDVRPYGGKGIASERCLMREPNGASSADRQNNEELR